VNDRPGASPIEFRCTRRTLLKLLGGLALPGSLPRATWASARGEALTPLRLPHPLPVYTQRASFVATGASVGELLEPSEDPFLEAFTVLDDVVVSPELERYVLCAWGDRVFPDADHYIGYNHDYTGFVPLDPQDREGRDGILWINHEYVSFPFSKLAPRAPLDCTGPSTRDSFAAVVGFDPGPARGREWLGEMFYNLGGSAIRIRRDEHRRFAVVRGDARNRRVHGLSGLAINAHRRDGYAAVTSWGERAHQRGDDRYLVGTGPAARDVFEAVNGDGLGNKIIGTAYNCSGATTPWGTILSGEENFQAEIARGLFLGVTEAVDRDGVQIGYVDDSAGGEFGLVGEKYGWIVEIDPLHPDARAKKHTALGRMRHENVALRCEAGKPLIAYSGDDRRGGHVYKYVSKERVTHPADPNNSRLLEDGTLYVARLHVGGTGRWIALALATPTDPNVPSDLSSGERARRADGGVADEPLVALPSRAGVAGATREGGAFVVTRANEDVALPAYRNKTLGDFYRTQGAVLCDAFQAANLVGGTPGARPEDVEVHPLTGEVLIAYSSGDPGPEGYPDSRIFTVGKYIDDVRAPQPHGALVRIVEEEPADGDRSFRWQRLLVGGEVGAEGGCGFANLDNLAFDGDARLWCVTDVPREVQNGAWNDDTYGPTCFRHDTAMSGKEGRALAGVFGSSWIFVLEGSGDTLTVVPVAYGPIGCELTGPTWIGDTLLCSVQHPGEDAPINEGVEGDVIVRNVAMLDLAGELRVQRRTLARGSNWPSPLLGAPHGPPRPAVTAIVRKTVTPR
jgi:secreted PhoX family phosphatase